MKITPVMLLLAVLAAGCAYDTARDPFVPSETSRRPMVQYYSAWPGSEDASNILDKAWGFEGAYHRELTPHLAWRVSAGYFKATLVDGFSVSELEGGRALGAIEIGVLDTRLPLKYYLAIGGGHLFVDDTPFGIDDEPLIYTGAGIEVYGKFGLDVRLEGGHMWLLESSLDQWLLNLVFAYSY